VADREIKAIENSSIKSRRHRLGVYHGPGLYCPTSEKKLSVLKEYKKVSKYLLRKHDTPLLKPILWHTDLHADNIFVDPDAPTRILSILDWQSTSISPLFWQARVPSLLDFDGHKSETLQPVKFPDNFDQLNLEEQRVAKELQQAQTLRKVYRVQTLKECEHIYRALTISSTLPTQIIVLAGSIVDEGEVAMKRMLVNASQRWSQIVGTDERGEPSVQCPLSYSEEDIKELEEEEAKWIKSIELKNDLIKALGAYPSWDGWVKNDEFDAMKARLETCRENFLDHHASNSQERRIWGRAWPFGDTDDLNS
jgi:hypothetical protein